LFFFIFISVPSIASYGAGKSTNIAGFLLHFSNYVLYSLLVDSLILVIAAAHATRARQTKSSSYEIDSGSSG